jgi:hypothetical protein
LKIPAEGDTTFPVVTICLLRVQKRKRGTRGNRQRMEFPKEWAGGEKEYLQFVLYKDNLETQVPEIYLNIASADSLIDCRHSIAPFC